MIYKKGQTRDRFLQALKLLEMEKFAELGWGITDTSIAYETDEDTKKFVNQSTGITINKGYTLKQSVQMEVYSDNPIFSAVDKIRRNLAIGTKSEGQLLNINLYETEEKQPTSVTGERFDVAITVTDWAGPSEDPLSITFDINYNSAPELGMVAIDWEEETFTFTAGEPEGANLKVTAKK